MGSSQALQRCGRKWASGLPKVYREPASSCAFRDKPVNSAKRFCIFHSPSCLILPAFEKIMHRTGREIFAIPVPEFGKIVWGRRPVRQGDPIPCGGNRNILKSGHEKAAGTVPFRPRSDENFPRFWTDRLGCRTLGAMMDIFLAMMDVFSEMMNIFSFMLDKFFSMLNENVKMMDNKSKMLDSSLRFRTIFRRC